MQSSSKYSLIRRIGSALLSAAMIGSVFAAAGSLLPFMQAPEVSAASTVDYGLADTSQHGVILHCWNWSYNNIKKYMKDIAAAGYTSIQTSPVQQPKDYYWEGVAYGNVGIPNGTGGEDGNWWKAYQPVTFSICDNGYTWYGTKAEFKAMCDEAEKYGVKVIVDIVANHMGNIQGYKIADKSMTLAEQQKAVMSDISPQVGEFWKKDMLTDPSYWHISTSWTHSSDERFDVTQGNMGMPDLNTGDSKVQQMVLGLLKECIDCGADGFRFDAAKHIETPKDKSAFASNFWDVVLDGARAYYKQKNGYDGIYFYGEVLNRLDDPNAENYYLSKMSLTDNSKSDNLRNSVINGSVESLADSGFNGYIHGKADHAVLWPESHDTYMGGGSSYDANDRVIKQVWAIVASRKDSTGLFFARPYYSKDILAGDVSQARQSTAAIMENIDEQTQLGDVGTLTWADPAVVAANRFRNYFVGQSERLGASGHTAYNLRGKTGIVIVRGGGPGAVSLSVGMQDGTYYDQVTGEKFTVSGGVVKGNVKNADGIAVVYNPSKDYGKVTPVEPTVIRLSAESANGSNIFTTDTVSVTMKNPGRSTVKYTTSEGASGSFTNGQKITLGASSAIGASITLNLSGTKSDGTQASASYTYTKKDPSAVTTIYFDNNAYQWSKVYAYIYNKTGTDPIPDQIPPTPSSNILFTNSLNWWNVKAYFFNSSGTVGEPWPGSSMTAVGDNGYGSTNFSIAIPNGATMVIFNDNGGTQTKDLPLAGVAGYWLDGSADNAKSWSNAAALQSSDTAPAASDNTPCNAPWPGQEMKQDAASGYYSLVVPDAFQNGLVIFSDGKENTKSRYPADLEEGLSIGGSSKLFAANHSWKDYAPPVPSKLSVSLNVSASTIRLGQTVTLTASASGASGAVTYSYQANSTSVSGSGSTVSWTPTAAGTYTVTVTAKDSGGTACASKIVTVEKKEDPVPTLVNNASLSASSVTLGKSVTISGTASGGKAPYQYAFYVKKTSSDSYSTLQDFSSDTNAVYTPTAAASYRIKVKVKDSLGTVKEKLMTLEVTKPVTALTNLSSLSAETIPLGSHLTVNCKASGGTAPYQYAVSYKKSSSASYSTVQAYSANKTVTFKPAAATVYQVMVKVKDAKDAVKSLTFDLTVTGTPVSKLNNTSKVSAASVALGKSITMTASATGGTSPYRYGFSYRKGTSGNFTLLKNYSTAKTYTFTPKSSGIYTLCMKVKDAKNQVVLKKITVKVTLAALTNTSTLSASSVKLGKSITVNCKASGGKSPYQYAVAVKKASSENYVSVTGYTKTTAVTYKPAAATEYIVRVKVKDASGNISSKLLNFTVKK